MSERGSPGPWAGLPLLSRFTVGQLLSMPELSTLIRFMLRHGPWAGLGASFSPPVSLLFGVLSGVRTSPECQNRLIYRGERPVPVTTRFTVGR